MTQWCLLELSHVRNKRTINPRCRSVPSLVGQLSISPYMTAPHEQRSTRMNGPNVNSCVFAHVVGNVESQRGGEPAFMLGLSWLTDSRLKTNRVFVQIPSLPSFKAN